LTAASVPVMVRLPAWRARFALVLLLAAFAVLAGRSIYLQSVKTGFLQEKGEARYARVLEVPATRGRIVDRNGEALAISTPVKSIWAIPDDVKATPAQLKALSGLIQLDSRELARRLSDADRDFVYLKRQIPPEVAARVAELAIPGVHQQNEYRRYYPGGETMAQVVGFTGVDDAGQEGIELAHQQLLAGAAGSRRVIKDRRGSIVEDVESIRAAQDGRDLTLSLDSKIQNIAFGALKAGVEANRAKAGAIVVLDVRTGEVLALANLPTYNPNNRARLNGAQLRNRVLTDNFEPGSTLKPFTVALAMETGRLTAQTRIDTAPGTLTIANYTIHDSHPGGTLSVAQVIQKSSNVGAAKIALGLPREEMHGMFRRVGFGIAPKLGFPGEAAGRLREAKTWRPIEQATMAYGHGISVSARLHGVRARRRARSAHARQDRRASDGRARVLARGRARSARDAGGRGSARRHGAARAHHGLARGRQDRYRAQAGERRLRRQQIRFFLRRFRAGVGAAPGDRGDDR
jgi:cell division protein FtsI (penicillin-binding protein 3)